MDENSGQNTDLLDPPEAQQSGPSMGEKAGDAARGIKNAASTAKDVMGAVKGGAGDGLTGGGIGGALDKGLGAIGGMGGKNKSMDGMKGNNFNTPDMFKGMEGGNNPAKKNDTSVDKANPSAADFAKKAGAHVAKNSETGQKAVQAADDAIKTAKDVQNVARIASTGGADVAADLAIAKELAAHPIQTAKRYGRVGLYAAGFFLLQAMVVMAIFGAVFFGVYKVYLTFKEATKNPLDISSTLRVTTEMGGWLADAVTELTYERQLAEAQRGGGVVLAQAPENTEYSLDGVELSPESKKMHDTWDSAGLAAKFVDDYNARIEPNGTTRQVDTYDPSAWNLYVNNNLIGTLESDRAKAFISIFAEDTTRWKDIYTRATLKNAARTTYGATSFKLDLPDSDRQLDNSRENVTKQLVSSSLKPVSERSEQYYRCMITGESACDQLGLGSVDSPANQKDVGSFSILGVDIGSLLSNRNNSADKLVTKAVGEAKLSTYTASKADDIDASVSSYSTKDELDANIRTGASDSVLSSIGVDSREVLLEMYDRFQVATDNENFARVSYDRQAQQSVSQSLNYFIAGGQLLNNEMGLLDSWAMTENLSILEESPVFRQAVLGNQNGVFAQGEESTLQDCQDVYNDELPVGKASEGSERPIKQASCFTKSLVPSAAEINQEEGLNDIYNLIREKNEELNQSGGNWFTRAFSSIFTQKIAERNAGNIRTSPVAAAAVEVDGYGPEFDAYTNSVYGISKSGAEINGDAYDTMSMAAETLWSSAAIDPATSIGGRYQTDAEVASTIRFAQKFERLRYAYKPVSERLFSMKSSDSLAGKLALLTPTNRSDTKNKTLALFRPGNLSSAVASRLTPTTFAQSSTDPNQLSAVRIGIGASDPSNTMTGSEIYSKFDCGTGGPEQTKAKVEGVPFTLPNVVNPCQREAKLAQYTTCWFEPGDTCSTESDTGSVAPPQSGAKGEDTSGLPCAAGATSERIVTIAGGVQRKLCDYGEVKDVDASWSSNVAAMLNAARGKVSLAGSGFRTADAQIELRRKHCGSSQFDIYEKRASQCSPPTARPGTSNHELGLAVDFQNCSTRATACYVWLKSNAEQFGVFNLPSEPWHWSVDGG